jgi:hypothetical protein
VALDLLETLTDARITKAVNKVRNTLPDLFNYFDIATPIVDELMVYNPACVGHKIRLLMDSKSDY